jgi:hypothetical protein
MTQTIDRAKLSAHCERRMARLVTEQMENPATQEWEERLMRLAGHYAAVVLALRATDA